MRKIFARENLCDEIREKTATLVWLQEAYDKMLEVSDDLLAVPDNTYLQNPLGYTARTIGGKVGALYTTWVATSEERYLSKAIKMFMEAVEAGFDFYFKMNHHLAIGDAALAISVSYSLLYDQLNENQRLSAEKIITELAHWLHTEDSTWGLPSKSVTSCNHNCVHYGALGICGMILENEEWLSHGLDRVKGYIKFASDETGYIPESLSYHNYGMQTCVIFCEAYKEITGIQLLDKPALANQFIAHMLPTPGECLKLNDHGSDMNLLPQLYYMNRHDNAAGMYLIWQHERANGEYFSHYPSNMKGGFVYPFIYMFANTAVIPKSPVECGTPLTQIFECGRVMTRTAWEDERAIYLSITCGYNDHSGHNHADKGGFNIYGLGEDFLVDVGKDTNEDRSHNIMMINGIGQPKGVSRGEILTVEDKKDSLFVVCDTTHSYVYTPSTLLGMARRNIIFVKEPIPYLIIRDDMQVERAKEEEQFYEFMMHTKKGNRFVVDDKSIEIIGQKYGNKCRLSFVYPQRVDVKISDEKRYNIAYRQSICCTDFYEEAIASTTSYNPFMTTVITFANAGEEYPIITTDGTVHDLNIMVEKDGIKSLAHVTRFNIEVSGS